MDSVQSLSRVWLFVTPWTTAHQASLSITNSWSPPKPISIVSMMPSNHLILCHPLLLPSIFPSIRVFSNESALRIRWPKYWSFSFNDRCRINNYAKTTGINQDWPWANWDKPYHSHGPFHFISLLFYFITLFYFIIFLSPVGILRLSSRASGPLSECKNE